MDPYEATRVKSRYVKLLNKLKSESKFTLKELESLLLIHHQARSNDVLDRRKFRSFIHNALDMTDGTITDRIFVSFDKSSTNSISVKEFIHGLSLFLRGTPREQADFCFSVYNSMGDGKISRENMFQNLRKCVVRAASEEDAEDGAKDLVEVLFKFCDKDKDGRVNLDDFRKVVETEPLLMEALGPCLPDRQARDAFLTAFAENPPTY